MVIGCDPNCEFRHLCSFTRICCGGSKTMGQKIAMRARTLSMVLRDFVVREGKKLGLLDIYVYDPFRQRLEMNAQEREGEREQASSQEGERAVGDD